MKFLGCHDVLSQRISTDHEQRTERACTWCHSIEFIDSSRTNTLVLTVAYLVNVVEWHVDRQHCMVNNAFKNGLWTDVAITFTSRYVLSVIVPAFPLKLSGNSLMYPRAHAWAHAVNIIGTIFRGKLNDRHQPPFGFTRRVWASSFSIVPRRSVVIMGERSRVSAHHIYAFKTWQSARSSSFTYRPTQNKDTSNQSTKNKIRVCSRSLRHLHEFWNALQLTHPYKRYFRRLLASSKESR